MPLHRISEIKANSDFLDGKGLHLPRCDGGRACFDVLRGPRAPDHVLEVDDAGLPNGLLDAVQHHDLGKKEKPLK